MGTKRKKLKLKENFKSSKKAAKEEKALEKFLFGADAADIDSLALGAELPAEEEKAFFVDDKIGDPEESGPVAAWEDEDDDEITVNIATESRSRKLRQKERETVISGKEYTQRLRNKFEQLNQTTTWATLPQNTTADKEHGSDSDSDDDQEDNLLQSTTPLLNNVPQRLPPTYIQLTRMKDANVKDPSNAVVQSVEFHSGGEILMTAGMDKTIRLFQVDGLRNPKIQGIHLPDLPIHKAAFTPDGNEIVCTGRRKFFYVYDIQKGDVSKVPFVKGRDEKSWENFLISGDGKLITLFGNNGYIVLVDRRTKQWVGNMKMNGAVRGGSYSKDGSTLYTHGDEGRVMIWDIRKRTCVGAIVDDGCLNGTAVALSPNSNYLATGSDSGVVNLYDSSNGFSSTSTPAPLKTIMSLTTPIDYLKFNHDSQILLTASRRQKDSLKLIHLPTMTTYSNWPTSTTPLHYVSAVDFSPKSGYMAIGNARGRVLLYRLNHFPSI